MIKPVFVKIPNRFGVIENKSIDSLTDKQLDIQIYNCNSQLVKLEKEYKFMHKCNLHLSKDSLGAFNQVGENVKRMLKIENTLTFLKLLKPSLEEEYSNRHNVLDKLSNEYYQAKILQTIGEDYYVE